MCSIFPLWKKCPNLPAQINSFWVPYSMDSSGITMSILTLHLIVVQSDAVSVCTLGIVLAIQRIVKTIQDSGMHMFAWKNHLWESIRVELWFNAWNLTRFWQLLSVLKEYCIKICALIALMTIVDHLIANATNHFLYYYWNYFFMLKAGDYTSRVIKKTNIRFFVDMYYV